MTDTEMTDVPAQDAKRKPRLVLMGEFSAGKSTLSNILLGSRPLPMRVTATRLPPVHICYGTPGAWVIDLEDQRTSIELENLESVALEEAQYIELHMQADALEHCDLVDMPGISDPNMPQRFWENVVGPSDHVIWCTHATQAWRQSEAAIWNILRPNTSGRNILLITQFDKLQSERDKKRVLRRLQHETQGQFDAIYPVFLLAALEACEDDQTWHDSGAAAFTDHVAQLLLGDAHDAPELGDGHVLERTGDPQDVATPSPEADNPQTDLHAASEQETRIVPRRIHSRGDEIPRERPDRRSVVTIRHGL